MFEAILKLSKQENNKIEILTNSAVTKLFGDILLSGVEVTNILTNDKKAVTT